MLIAIIPIQSIEKALHLMQQASKAELFEFRLDYLPQINLEQIQYLQQQAKRAVLFTLRKSQQGGVYAGNEASRLELILQLIGLQPQYLDIEHDVPLDFCQQLKKLSPQTRLICSYHNFTDTPEDLPQILRDMIDPIFSGYKIITTAHTILDTLKVLHFVKHYAPQYPLIAHAMGEVGEVSRILGKIFGNIFTYASVDNEKMVPGLLSVNDLVNIYHYPDLNKDTQIYGLIGDPIAQSVGHLYHNLEFVKAKQNAVYVKFWVKHEELGEFFQAIKDLPIQGLSITMPHKQVVLQFCKELTKPVQMIGAANTLIKQTDGFLAANTDGDAVVQVLGEVSNKKVILIGAGGAASSIIYSLIQAGATVSVYNRTLDKLDALRQKYPVETYLLQDVDKANYDILINTIPAKFYQNNLNFIKNKIILDINYQPTPTLLIQDAIKQGCICIDGYAMFYEQARRQQQLWQSHFH